VFIDPGKAGIIEMGGKRFLFESLLCLVPGNHYYRHA
jgi:hypothetical protein